MLARYATLLAVVLIASPFADGALVITDTEPGAFVDISTFGTGLALGDDGVAQIWPTLDLYGTLFAGGFGSVWISNNGALGFVPDGSFGAYYLNAQLPDPSLFGAGHDTPQALAVYWDDLDSETGEVFHATVGSFGSRTFVVQWQDRPHYPGDPLLDGSEVTFQVQIFEAPGPVKAQFVYGDVDFLDVVLDDGASATIGYQSGGVGNNAQWSCNRAGAVTAGTVLTLLEIAPGCEDLGDGNGDCHLDLTDYSGFSGCLTGPAAPSSAGCGCYDIDQEGHVDLRDYARFQNEHTGPVEIIPDCGP